MNENVIKLVDAIKSGDALATEQAFADAMADKLGSKIEDLRVNIAQNMFKQETVAEEYEEVQLTQEEYDALSEEDKTAFTLDEGIGKFVGKIAKGTANVVGNVIGGVAKTVGALRQTPAAIGAAYNRGRAGAQKSIDK